MKRWFQSLLPTPQSTCTPELRNGKNIFSENKGLQSKLQRSIPQVSKPSCLCGQWLVLIFCSKASLLFFRIWDDAKLRGVIHTSATCHSSDATIHNGMIGGPDSCGALYPIQGTYPTSRISCQSVEWFKSFKSLSAWKSKHQSSHADGFQYFNHLEPQELLTQVYCSEPQPSAELPFKKK